MGIVLNMDVAPQASTVGCVGRLRRYLGSIASCESDSVLRRPGSDRVLGELGVGHLGPKDPGPVWILEFRDPDGVV